MERKNLIAVLLLVSAVTLAAVSIWLFADTPKVLGVSGGTRDAPKVGITAGVIAAVVGIAIFVVKDTTQQLKNFILGAILLALIFAITTFSLAIKERMDVNKRLSFVDAAKDFTKSQHMRGQQDFNFGNKIQVDPHEIFKTLKTQLVVLAVAGIVASLLELVALILLSRKQPSQTTTRSAMPMEKPY